MANSIILNKRSEAGGYVLYVSFWLFPFLLYPVTLNLLVYWFLCFRFPSPVMIGLSDHFPRYPLNGFAKKKKSITEFGALGTLSHSPFLPFTRTWHGVCLLVYLSIVFLFQRVVISSIIYCLTFSFLAVSVVLV